MDKEFYDCHERKFRIPRNWANPGVHVHACIIEIKYTLPNQYTLSACELKVLKMKKRSIHDHRIAKLLKWSTAELTTCDKVSMAYLDTRSN